ncbi:hypothetical protein DPEC_G00233860 [Dallia pectoralis]|uniref:Uncharacterized protein n=1 Tax=Dallia pectoralis TaxID=75939 RepID=A0ACC2FXE7_DALPE|nr:hypothetical protein DPEC_G00233860 [Dallia pectoralis]
MDQVVQQEGYLVLELLVEPEEYRGLEWSVEQEEYRGEVAQAMEELLVAIQERMEQKRLGKEGKNPPRR